MKTFKRICSFFLCISLSISLLYFPAEATSINDNSVFITQSVTGSSGTCTLASATMMLRRHAILNGNSAWNNITEEDVGTVAWINGQLRFRFSYQGATVITQGLISSGYGTVEKKRAYFISMLQKHPEGIVIFNHSHAVLLTDYDSASGVFYCADPAHSRARIRLADSTLASGTQESRIDSLKQIWYIVSGTSIPKPTVSSELYGKWIVTIPANYKLICYNRADASQRSQYWIEAKATSYSLSCTKKATLSNGKTRYFFVSGDNKNLWFDYANSMSIKDLSQSVKPDACVVTFDPDGGSVSPRTLTVTADSCVASLPVPTRNGYKFSGWGTNRTQPGGGSTTIVNEENLNQFTSGKKKLTLYAQWNKDAPKTYTVMLNANGGTVSKTSLTVTTGSSYGSLPIPDREGYTFQGWYTSRNGGDRITVSSTVNLSENQTLYAVWEKISEARYAITFDGNGGDVSQTTIYVNLGSVYGSLPTPERNGYRFDGWFTGRVGGTQISESSTVSFAGDQTLFAHWTQASEETHFCTNHVPGKFIYRDLKDSPHPHYNYYKCANCGEIYTDGGTAYFADCPLCNPPKESKWGSWSDWSATPAYASSTREVETRTVKVLDGVTEYRYGRYIDNTGKNDCWCGTYLESLPHISGRANLDYSAWTTTPYGTSGKNWTCGYCSGPHTGIDHVNPDGRPAWVEYLSPNGDSYYWEEMRISQATYETQYRYRDKM